MKEFLKRFVCLITAIVCFIFSAVAVQASAEITFEQEMMIYFNANSYEQSIPYTFSYFQNLVGWSTCSENFNTFVENSVYDNRFYYSFVSSNDIKRFFVVNYDYISSFNDSTKRVVFNKCVIIELSTSFVTSSSDTYEKVSSQVKGNYNTEEIDYDYSLSAPISSVARKCYQFSVNGSALILYDGTLLEETSDENSKSYGIKSLLGLHGDMDFEGKWKGEVSLLNGLVELKGEYENGLATSLTDSLGVDVSVGDSTYNEVLTDLVDGTKTSQVWNNLDNSTTSSIEKTYNNLKNTFDNSVRAYKDTDNNYYYTNSISEGDSNYFNYEDDTVTYYQTYIYDDGSSDGGDVTSAPSGSTGGSGNGGAYAYASAQAEGGQGGAGGNASIGDIIINNNGSSGTGSSSDGGDVTSATGTSSESEVESDVTTSTVTDVDISTFEELVNSCSNFWDLLKNIFNIYPAVVWTCLASGITVVVICRLLGR